MAHITLKDRARTNLMPGIDVQTFWGENMLLSVAELEPHAVLPPHSHSHEQGGVILEGELTLTIDGDTRVLRPGDIYIAEGGVEHSGQAGPHGCRALDIFSPVREEYKFQAQA